MSRDAAFPGWLVLLVASALAIPCAARAQSGRSHPQERHPPELRQRVHRVGRGAGRQGLDLARTDDATALLQPGGPRGRRQDVAERQRQRVLLDAASPRGRSDRRTPPRSSRARQGTSDCPRPPLHQERSPAPQLLHHQGRVLHAGGYRPGHPGQPRRNPGLPIPRTSTSRPWCRLSRSDGASHPRCVSASRRASPIPPTPTRRPSRGRRPRSAR